eukprot:CAMPEP_0183326202 /NCGR_PEP_ID=MMETSP0160_2-20130417/81558_1 /TAXON_ID=2839 ORGANISM="Odontella Sinensis, Strain Grunow 1884" /NCGR_SAMPLE_ID=MMETSP0160_2 /ASSEMBLY_ACC=CAM_ASM_000250 /LENGTH=69 /DNA_ID=CAMNT_0025494135 /DNA_START=208 /DNA_END=413 /DNA_ORIENTATION=-
MPGPRRSSRRRYDRVSAGGDGDGGASDVDDRGASLGAPLTSSSLSASDGLDAGAASRSGSGLGDRGGGL